MGIEVLEARADNALVLQPVGRLDSSNARAFEKLVITHISTGELHLVVDFSRLVFISSSGMRVLLIAAKKLQHKSGALVLCSMRDSIREIFSISGFDHIIPVCKSREDALKVS